MIVVTLRPLIFSLIYLLSDKIALIIRIYLYKVYFIFFDSISNLCFLHSLLYLKDDPGDDWCWLMIIMILMMIMMMMMMMMHAHRTWHKTTMITHTHKHTNTQIHKHTNTQTHKHTNTRRTRRRTTTTTNDANKNTHTHTHTHTRREYFL